VSKVPTPVAINADPHAERITLTEIVANEDSKLFNAMILLMKCYFYFSRPYSNPHITTHQCLTLIHANHLTCTYCIQAVGQRNVSAVPTPVAINADPHAETHAVCPIPE
jgi:hypothetical protein